MAGNPGFKPTDQSKEFHAILKKRLGDALAKLKTVLDTDVVRFNQTSGVQVSVAAKPWRACASCCRIATRTQLELRMEQILPHRDNAFVPREKLVNYLLSELHPVGGPKAAFFRMHGFDDANIAALEAQLLEVARSAPVAEILQNPYGTKYVLDGCVLSPSGARLSIRTVWIIEAPDERPRFVTAFPH